MFISKKERNKNAVITAFLFSATLLFCGPLSIYINNNIDLPFTFLQIWMYLIGLSAVTTLLITLLLCLFNDNIYRKLAPLVFATACLIWFQGNILNWDYGVLDGKEIVWRNYVMYGALDSSIWIIILLFTFIKSNFVYSIIKKGSLFIILMQMITIGYNWYNAPNEPQYKKYTYTDSSQFTYSSDNNVIVLLLDTFQTDVFQEIINEQPKYKEIFSGFTYYRNSLGGFPTTYPSVPLIMTGQYYDNSEPIQDFLHETYQKQSIPLVLKRNGFDVGLYPMVEQTIYPTEDIASNVKEKGSLTLANFHDVYNLYELTFFKHLPHFLKKYFHNTEILDNGSKTRDIEFMERAENETRTGLNAKSFKFYHLAGVHAPYDMNEQLEKVLLSQDRHGYKTKAKAALKITNRFLQTLKDKGVYEKSQIFIVGDHGAGQEINLFATEHFEQQKLLNNPVMASGIPLILYKPLGSSGELNTSDAPVSLADIPATIMSQLAIKETFPGESFIDIQDGSLRERKFLYYSWDHEYWKKESLPSMTEYSVRGFSWNSNSWGKTGNKFINGTTAITPYKYGSEIQFGLKGNSGEFESWGFSVPEDGFNWTSGNSAVYTLSVTKPTVDLILEAKGFPFVTDKIKDQTINVSINGTELAHWAVTGEGLFTVTIPKDIVTDGTIELSMDLPNAISPFEAGINSDIRKIAFAMQSLKISEKH